jgi:hypothetical protein
MRSTSLAMILLAGGACALAEEPAEKTLAVTVETGVMSSYLWRGWVLNDSPSMQPAVTFSYRGLTVGSWSNLSRRVPHNQAWTEHDLTFEYARTVKRFTLSAGYLDYRFPDLRRDENNRTKEISAGISYASFLNPSLKVYRDVSLGRGYYYAAGFSHPVAVWRNLVLTPAATAGLNQHQYIRQTTISDLDLGLTAEMPLGKHWKASAQAIEMIGHRSLFGHHHAVGAKLTYIK